MELQVEQVVAQFETELREQKCVSGVLDLLLEQLGGRAIGLWRCEAGNLLQVGFRAVPDMDQQVQQDFAALTHQVSLENTGLGIVKAALERKPAIGMLSSTQSGLPGSSEWLLKFGAQQSYAVPVFEADEVAGVLAISTDCIHQAGDAEWEIQTRIADGIGKKKLLGML
ncbi:hypothetical protein [Gimesia panareensis]|uniref:Uncharacterized protein n=1 Tax=Gimesia panareensis TaxID=2527978 RepID=A0A518A5T3_9PLAN|nr:hypothetical protein [Gimesia panareensis]QDU50090.1 hypothetical protein Pan110_24320 [Gimesia panareensis]QDV16624.1 hypothetical protein Pan153_12550 [Gimesia panareensis]